MYERLKAMYLTGRLSRKQLALAVSKGWITKAEADKIINGGTAEG